MATAKKSSSKSQAEGDRYFVLAFRTGMDAIENTVVSAAEIPLSVLSGMGVSPDTTDAAREANKQLAHGIHGTVDAIVTQIADAVTKETELAAATVSGMAKSANKG
jgi:hypothetical protein